MTVRPINVTKGQFQPSKAIAPQQTRLSFKGGGDDIIPPPKPENKPNINTLLNLSMLGAVVLAGVFGFVDSIADTGGQRQFANELAEELPALVDPDAKPVSENVFLGLEVPYNTKKDSPEDFAAKLAETCKGNPVTIVDNDENRFNPFSSDGRIEIECPAPEEITISF